MVLALCGYMFSFRQLNALRGLDSQARARNFSQQPSDAWWADPSVTTHDQRSWRRCRPLPELGWFGGVAPGSHHRASPRPECVVTAAASDLWGCAVSAPDALTLHEAYGRELADMLELVRTGEAFSQPATAQRLSIRLVSVLTRLHEGHQVDERGRCSICWPRPRRWWRPWPRRALCTVHTAFGVYLPHAQESDLRRAL